MSVYTHLSASEVAAYLSQFSLGDYRSHQGISAGVENTNFFVEAILDGTQHKYVLTIFEHHNSAQVENFIKIGRHLADKDVPVPGPIADTSGVYLHALKDKPAILCPCLPGSHPEQLNLQHCIQIGVALARFHLAGKGLEGLEENNRGLQWWPEVGRELIQASMVTDLLDTEQQQVLIDEVEFQESNTELWYELPRGLIHGDLCFSNIFYDSKNKNFKLIDPRGKWGQGISGDLKYDVAKIRHSVVGGFDTITNGLYSATYTEMDGIFVDVYKPKNYECVCEKLDFRIKERWNLNEIKIIEGLLFVSMLPLHKDNFERIKNKTIL